MIKCILGEDRGLNLTLKKSPVYLCPSKKTKIEIVAQNTTEYDMHLYFSFGTASLVSLQNKEPDFFVPAEGDSVFTLEISASDGERLYMGTSLLEFKVTDRVLEWQNEYELEFFTECVFKCSDKADDFSADDGMLFSRDGIIYLSENENACIEAACTEREEYVLDWDGDAKALVYVNGKECKENVLTLEAGLNKISICCQKDGGFYFANTQNGKKVCLNTINPKFFL